MRGLIKNHGEHHLVDSQEIMVRGTLSHGKGYP